MARVRVGAQLACLVVFSALGMFYPSTAAADDESSTVAVLPHFVSGGEGEVDWVLVEKSDRRLVLMSGAVIVRSYPIALGRQPRGHKRSRGDGRTPEGTYVLDYRNEQSAFHRSIHISYPSDADSATAKTLGVDPGGDIMLHGLPNGKAAVGADHLAVNWTDGCIAVTNEQMDEIWQLVADGVPIEIRP